MNSNQATPCDQNTQLENFAAELTDAAYPIVLRHGVVGSSVDLELDLWKVLAERVKKLRQQAQRAGESPPDGSRARSEMPWGHKIPC
jgi:hypothetical protein